MSRGNNDFSKIRSEDLLDHMFQGQDWFESGDVLGWGQFYHVDKNEDHPQTSSEDLDRANRKPSTAQMTRSKSAPAILGTHSPIMRSNSFISDEECDIFGNNMSDLTRLKLAPLNHTDFDRFGNQKNSLCRTDDKSGWGSGSEGSTEFDFFGNDMSDLTQDTSVDQDRKMSHASSPELKPKGHSIQCHIGSAEKVNGGMHNPQEKLKTFQIK